MKIQMILLSMLSFIISCGNTESDKKKSGSVLQEISREGREPFKPLPLSGKVAETNNFWSGDHWPVNKSSVSLRWQTGEANSLAYQSPTFEELSALSEEDIALLSPSEKYDIFMGNYDYPFKKSVQEKINLVALAWEGVGDGWAAATAFHGEPAPVTLTNKDNITVSFASSDVKALLSYYYSHFHASAKEQMGLRCNSPQETAEEDKNCNNDLTAAQFHVALAKVVGTGKRTLIMDLDRYEQVWNHPILAYESTILQDGDPTPEAPKEAKKTIAIKTKVTYLDRSYNHAWNPVKSTWNQVKTNRVYSYQLHLNGNGQIIGSQWVSFDRPDFLWIPQMATGFTGKLAGLSSLLKAAPSVTPAPEPEVVPRPEEENTESETETTPEVSAP